MINNGVKKKHANKKVAKEIGKIYGKSGDENLAQLAEGYYIMEEEAKGLSKLVEKQLLQYDKEILKNHAILGVDPEAIQNGGFETGNASYWTVGGSGDHSVTSEDRYSGSYSLRLGYKYSANVANSRDWAYQTISLPSYATNIKLSFYYHLFTEDSANFDWFEAYIRDSSGSNLAQVFKKGGVDYPGLEVYGWEKVTYDLSAYAGQTIQIYFAVANWYDTLYKTWCYIDDVSLTYDYACTFECFGAMWISCIGQTVPLDMLTCVWGCVVGCIIFGPAYPLCLWPCIQGICGASLTIDTILCLIQALDICSCI